MSFSCHFLFKRKKVRWKIHSKIKCKNMLALSRSSCRSLVQDNFWNSFLIKAESIQAWNIICMKNNEQILSVIWHFSWYYLGVSQKKILPFAFPYKTTKDFKIWATMLFQSGQLCPNYCISHSWNMNQPGRWFNRKISYCQFQYISKPLFSPLFVNFFVPFQTMISKEEF